MVNEIILFLMDFLYFLINCRAYFQYLCLDFPHKCHLVKFSYMLYKSIIHSNYPNKKNI